MLIDAILWVVLIGMIAVVPCGCIMTRSAEACCTGHALGEACATGSNVARFGGDAQS